MDRMVTFFVLVLATFAVILGDGWLRPYLLDRWRRRARRRASRTATR